jgi:hypothetical protein
MEEEGNLTVETRGLRRADVEMCLQKRGWLLFGISADEPHLALIISLATRSIA